MQSPALGISFSLTIPPRRLPARTTREKVERLEQHLLQYPQVDLKTQHCLSGGVYARSITLPADTIITGAVHKHDHIVIVTGDITVTTEDGPRRFTGQHVFPVAAGSKRAGFAHAETVWTTVHSTNKTSPEDIEDDLVEEADRLQTRNPQLGMAPLALPEKIQ
jgi:hypothetical protein